MDMPVWIKMMRQSDRKLTDKIYTETNLIPVGEVIRNLPDNGPLPEILEMISDASFMFWITVIRVGICPTNQPTIMSVISTGEIFMFPSQFGWVKKCMTPLAPVLRNGSILPSVMPGAVLQA